MITALLILAALTLFIQVIALVVGIPLLIQSVKEQNMIATMVGMSTARVLGIEKLLVAVHTLTIQTATRGTPNQPPQHQHDWQPMRIGQEDGQFITEDGQHVAGSFDELMQKISKDPRYRVADDLDIEHLREKFQEYADEFGDGNIFDDQRGDMEPPVDGDEWKDA